jgi:hypothetical protein
MIQLSDFIFEARDSKTYSPEVLKIMADTKAFFERTAWNVHYASICFVEKDLYKKIISNYNEIPSTEKKKNKWINIATLDGDPVISVAQTENVYRKPIDRDLYYSKSTSAVENKLNKVTSDFISYDTKLCPYIKNELKDAWDVTYIFTYIITNYTKTRNSARGNWQYIGINSMNSGSISKGDGVFDLYIAFSKETKEWKLVKSPTETASATDYKKIEKIISELLGKEVKQEIQEPVIKPEVKPAPVAMPVQKPVVATAAKTIVKKTSKYYQTLLSDALKTDNVVKIKDALKEIIEKFGKQSQSYKDEIWLHVDSETLGDFWNSYPEAFIYDTKRKNIYVSIYYQGDSTDGSKQILFDDIWRNSRYVFRVTHSYGNGDYDDDRIYVEKQEVKEILQNIADNWLSAKEVKKRKEIADAKARIAPLAAAVDDLLGNELFSKYGGRGGSMTQTDHVNGKEAAREWFAKNKEELAKNKVSVEQVKDMARKVYMNNKKPDSYFYEVNRYGWRGKKLRDYNLDI